VLIRRTLLSCAAALLVATSTASAQESSVAGPANQAFVDAEGTATVTTQAKAALEAVFSYTWSDPETWRTAVRKWATGPAAQQLQELFGKSIGSIREQKLTVLCTAVDIGLRELRADTAQLLVYLNQKVLRTSAPQTISATAVLIRMQRGPQGWQLIDVQVPQ
jgi:Mce-associated membrane protein